MSLSSNSLISLVGGGSKTSLMFKLAAELSGLGKKVLSTTSTKIFYPSRDQSPLLVIEPDPSRLLAACRNGLIEYRHFTAVAGAKGEKLLGFQPEILDNLFASRLFDYIINEADGARRLPLKAPGEKEPVIPDCTTHNIAVVGLSCMGALLDEQHVCRSAIYSRLTGLRPGTKISPESVARILSHEQGLFKNTPAGCKKIVWLNQADLPGKIGLGQEVISCLTGPDSDFDRIILGSVLPGAAIFELWIQQ